MIPLMLAAIGLYALYKHVDVFPVFLRGAQKGLHTAVSILPTLVGMLTVVYMLRASGAIDLAADWLAPLFSVFGIPKDCVALALLKPISGGGGLALGSELIGRYGPDSYIGRVTAVMLGRIRNQFVHHQYLRWTLGIKANALCYTGCVMCRFGCVCRFSRVGKILFPRYLILYLVCSRNAIDCCKIC